MKESIWRVTFPLFLLAAHSDINWLDCNTICFLWTLYKYIINSLWPGGAKWRHRYGSSLAQVMVCCLSISMFNQQYFIIGSDNGWSLTRRQAIIWNNDGWFTDANMWHNELIYLWPETPRHEFHDLLCGHSAQKSTRTYILHCRQLPSWWPVLNSQMVIYFGHFKSFASGRSEWKFRKVIFKLISLIDGWRTSGQITQRLMSMEWISLID